MFPLPIAEMETETGLNATISIFSAELTAGNQKSSGWSCGCAVRDVTGLASTRFTRTQRLCVTFASTASEKLWLNSIGRLTSSVLSSDRIILMKNEELKANEKKRSIENN